MKNGALVLALVLSGVIGCSKSSFDKKIGTSKTLISFTEFSQSEGQSKISSTDTCDSECQKKRQEFRYVVYVGKQIYCYWDLKQADTGTDFTLLASSLEQSISTGISTSKYYRTLRRWASAFHDGHVNVFTGADTTALEIYTAPVRLEVLAPATDHEKIIISQTDPIAVNSGVAVGDQVLSVNGVETSVALTLASNESSSGSSERMRRFWAARRLVDVMGVDAGSVPLTLSVKSVSDGTIKNVVLVRNIQIDSKPGSAIAGPDTGIDNFSAKILPGGWGYFRLDAFSGSDDDRLISSTMDRLAGTNGLILDLRHNGGGDLSGDRIIERLITNAVVRYKRSERLSDFILSQRPSDNFALAPDASGQFAQWHDLMVSPLKDRKYNKPVVALISSYCFSACDTFSASLRDNHLATFIGESTGGGTGTPLVFELPVTKFSFRYSVIRGQSPNALSIEGVGTNPDIALEPALDDRVKPHDSQLARAIETLQKLTGQAPSGLAPAFVTPTWNQRLDVSPTVEEMSELWRIMRADSSGG
jgi:C-terminal processing protease CtpA/Prc